MHGPVISSRVLWLKFEAHDAIARVNTAATPVGRSDVGHRLCEQGLARARFKQSSCAKLHVQMHALLGSNVTVKTV